MSVFDFWLSLTAATSFRRNLIFGRDRSVAVTSASRAAIATVALLKLGRNPSVAVAADSADFVTFVSIRWPSSSLWLTQPRAGRGHIGAKYSPVARQNRWTAAAYQLVIAILGLPAPPTVDSG